jgi:hypothetical protein
VRSTHSGSVSVSGSGRGSNCSKLNESSKAI